MGPHPTTTEDRPHDWSPAVHRMCAHLGIDVPPPMTAEERAAWEHAEDEADADAARRYGLGYSSAA